MRLRWKLKITTLSKAAARFRTRFTITLPTIQRWIFRRAFLKRWLKDGTDKPKSEEEAEKEYPTFANQLKWSLISTKLINEHKITVDPQEIKNFAFQQIAGYMGMQNLDEAPWLDEYANRMMKDQKFVEETYMKIQTSKLFAELEQQVQAIEESISAEAFASKLHHHHH